MPSPFPGMDPFLEHPDVFPGLHDGLITYLREFLQPQLPAPYFADMGRRAWIEVSERFVGPDVEILHPRSLQGGARAATGSLATLERPAATPLVIRVPHDEWREPFLNVYTGRSGNRRLVTTIEILSPSNKTRGDQGRDLYLRKQREILDTRVHLVEIDLLRGGEHTTAVPRDRLVRKAGAFDYHVCVHRFDEFEDYFVYPFTLTDPLPTVSIPLLPDDDPVPLDLQAVFTRAYDTGPYAREIDYRHDRPSPPLPAKMARWARQRVTKR